MLLDHDAIRARIRERIDAVEELSVRNVSIAIGSDSALHKFLTGSNESIKLNTLAKIAEAIGVSPDWLLFGRKFQASDTPTALTEETVEEMVGTALEELVPGMSYGQTRQALASALHDQLKLRLAGVEVRSIADARSARDRAVQSPAPTKEDASEGSRTA